MNRSMLHRGREALTGLENMRANVGRVEIVARLAKNLANVYAATR
jgi:hypothetical protein